MSASQRSRFGSVLEVSPEQIVHLKDLQLNDLMRALFRVQTYKSGLHSSQAYVCSEEKANDDGCDGWQEAAKIPSKWFLDRKTCWQFKAGVAGEPKAIEGEVTKKIPAETLRENGRYVVVCSGLSNGKKGINARLDTLIKDATAANIPSTEIVVFGSEQLTIWVNQNPTISCGLLRIDKDFWTLEEWVKSKEHLVPWQASAELNRKIGELRNALDPINGTILHLHIQGPPGVGKSRFALELCRDAEWKDLIVYFRQAIDEPLIKLIESAIGDPRVQLVIVADEVQGTQLRVLRDSIDRGEGQVRLITIGDCDSPDNCRIPVHSVGRMDRNSIAIVVNSWYPSMPPEQVDLISRFADGYVRLAKLAAQALLNKTSSNLEYLLSRSDIRAMLNSLLGKEERKYLYVVAVLEKVGWTEDVACEGKAIAKALDIAWTDVRIKVDQFHERFSIAPQSGNHRYISPKPLGVYLAMEAWKALPDEMESLLDILPTEAARESYRQRRAMLKSTPLTWEDSIEPDI